MILAPDADEDASSSPGGGGTIGPTGAGSWAGIWAGAVAACLLVPDWRRGGGSAMGSATVSKRDALTGYIGAPGRPSASSGGSGSPYGFQFWSLKEALIV